MKLYIDENGNKIGIDTEDENQVVLIRENWKECQTKSDGSYATYYNEDGTINTIKENKEIASFVQEESKQAKEIALSMLTVTTANGNTFDADDIARQDMLSAIDAAETLGLTEYQWKLADNTKPVIQLAELKEASALAIQAKGAIILS